MTPYEKGEKIQDDHRTHEEHGYKKRHLMTEEEGLKTEKRVGLAARRLCNPGTDPEMT